jgi:hypothetical protein
MDTPPPPAPTRHKLPPRFGLRASLVLTLIVAAFFGGRASRNREILALQQLREVGGSRLEDQDQRFRRLVVGTWEDDYEGKRTMTLQEDGTGTMVVELDGLKAAIFAPRLQFEMVWSVENGRLKKQTLKGEPEVQVQLILKTMGDRVDEQILELTAKRLLLLDRNGQTKYDWRRVREIAREPGDEPNGE